MKRWIEGSYVKFGPRRFRALPTELMEESDSIFGIDLDEFAAGYVSYEPDGHWCEGDDPQATLVTSKLVPMTPPAWDLSMHWPVIDIDLPCAWVPSTNDGHGHLYINHPVTFEGLIEILTVLNKHGIVQDGYLHAAKIRGYSAVRLPGVRKPTSDV